MEQLNRITQQPEVMGGKACIRGMRVTVAMVEWVHPAKSRWHKHIARVGVSVGVGHPR